MSERLTWWVGQLCAKASWCLAVGNRKHAQRFLDEAVGTITRHEVARLVYDEAPTVVDAVAMMIGKPTAVTS
jgi:hypothetical protein